MSNRFLISVAAAALIAGTGLANAQGTSPSRDAPASGATQQNNAPPSAAPTNRDASQSGAPAEAPKAAQSKEMAPKAEKSAQDNMKGPASKDMKADTKAPADSKGTADNKAGSTATESKTTGNAATSATAAPPAEKRTQIVSAIKSEKIQETTNVNFNISVGAVIPSSVRFHALPPRIVEIYPEWRGYEVVYVKGRYIIVRPQTHEIVYIIEG
jgi:Protein of unknown function (DUF1236)